MNKVIVSTFLLVISIAVAFILYGIVIRNFPTWGEFYNVLFIGLTVFVLGIGVFCSALLIESSVREMRD
jgi:hypothetical protein